MGLHSDQGWLAIEDRISSPISINKDSREDSTKNQIKFLEEQVDRMLR